MSESCPIPTVQDRMTLRALAARVREIADHPDMPARRLRLREHTALRGDRPLVLVSPEGSWVELIPDAVGKTTSHPLLQSWEFQLRRKIYWWEQLRDDGAIDPYCDVGVSIAWSGYGVDIPYHHGANRGSHVWEAPLHNLDGDMEKLQHRTVTVDHLQTRDHLTLAGDMFGDLLAPRLRGMPFWTMGLTSEAIKLYGMEPFFAALAEDPDGVHRLMGFLRDDYMGLIDQFEAQGGFNLNNGSEFVCSGGYGSTTELPSGEFSGRVRAQDLWGFSESQETVGVSPRMFERHILPFQIPLTDRFGLVGYGCCEPIHQRLDAILKYIPKLRRVSVSPWSDQDICAERLQGKVIFSRKPNPALVCAGFHEEEIRKDLAHTASLADRARIEIILKDTHTVEQQPWRIRRWIEMAYQAIGLSAEPLEQRSAA
ncbi:MAG: hypothetical protein AAB263_12035 [Planctomycetota bacterium]